ncbi:MAG: hypothetical protein PVF85_12300 [Anaerolineales bacterium]|jgi:hypothetical protein
MLPAPAGGNGTKILVQSGEALSSDEIIPPRQVMVDGVLILSDPDYLNSALVIVDASDGARNDEASGVVEAVSGDTLQLTAGASPCDPVPARSM